MAKVNKRKSGNSLKENKSEANANRSILKWGSGVISLFLFALAVLLYGNTINHEYTQDDAIVIYDNMYTTQGIKGIPGLIKYDTFFGFFKEEGKAALVSGGRYRPLTPIMFAVEWQIFGNNPRVGHAMNILLYGLLGVLIFFTLDRLLEGQRYSTEVAIGAAIIFLVHPIHTEVVANIKGRDEIMSMVLSVGALFLVLKGVDLKQKKYGWLAGLVLFFGLLSKENTITFLAIIPISLYFFRSLSLVKSIGAIVPCILAAVAFLALRTAVLGFDFGGTPAELMNNPYIKIENGQYLSFDFGEKMATIIFTLGKYIQLLFFPHPLTHDYYPRHIEMMSFSDPSVLLSLVMYLLLIGFAVIGWKRKDMISYCILFYISSLSIVSNLIFPIGTNMSERFLFMPSLGFALALAYGAYLFYERLGNNKILLGLFLVPLIAFSAKTIMRNTVWENNYTLFTSDIAVSPNSAKLNNAVGGALANKYGNEENETLKREKLSEAISRLDKAIQLHPNYKSAHLIKANCHHYLDNFIAAEQSYAAAIRIDPGFEDAIANHAINYRELGKQFGAEKGDINSALKYLKISFDMNPNDYDTVRLLGIAYGNAGNDQEAITYFTKALELLPNAADAYANLAKAYSNIGNEEKSQQFAEQARNIDPNVFKK